MVARLDIYTDLADIIANMAPEKVIALKATPAQQKRMDELLEKNQEEGLSEEENIEVERLLMMNRVIALAKIRARRLLNKKS